jgi:D-arabinose 1-dehydrogenase-like Zn-dependent alcohol dehydrogenase
LITGFQLSLAGRSPACYFPLPQSMDDAEAAPLLCAGLIGWRSYRMAGEGIAIATYVKSDKGAGARSHCGSLM